MIFCIFLIGRVEYKAVRSPVCVKKEYNIAHTYFVNKATDLKTIFVKSL